MDCREFRDRHALLIDVRCSALEENEMREHMRACPRCARHDALIRRSLLLVRNLRPIEPSPGFRSRLEARLREAAHQPAGVRPPGFLTFGRMVALTAAAVLVAIVASEMVRTPAQPILMPPVVASTPAVEVLPLASPALVAAVPTGMSFWPAMMAASQVPMHYVATEMVDER